MSWSEIAGIHDELNKVKQVLQSQFGVSVKEGEIRDTDKEIDSLRNDLQAYLKVNEALNKRIEDMSLDLTRLTEEVSRAQTVQSSAVTLLRSLTEELAAVSAELAAKGDMEIDVAPLNALIDELKGSTDTLAGAVAESTPVEEAPVEAPVEVVPEAPAEEMPVEVAPEMAPETPVVDEAAPVEAMPEMPAEEVPVVEEAAPEAPAEEVAPAPETPATE